ncbi:peptidoglycan DD-metalloendopeptidase family protein [Streptomyces fractus]|uniref:aggregation-promoting factor C-terminal-like domain-containing protein n=1 Tax=Streptomyces fractus TaxID=641806 RepID=UPI003CF27C5B
MAGDLDIVGGAAVDVVPIVPNFHRKLKEAILPIADEVGTEAGRKMGEKMGDAMRASLADDGQRIGNSLGDSIGDALARRLADAIPDAINRGGQRARASSTRQGDRNAGAFADSMRRHLEAAFRAMPKLDIRIGDTGVDAELARIRAKLEQLSNKRIGVDVSAEHAEAEIIRLEEQLRELGAQHPNVAVRADTATARAALAAIRAEIAAIPGRREVGIEVDGALGAKLRAAVQAAEESLPHINVDADTAPAQREIQQLRGRLTALRDVRVGIDISAADALAQVREIQLKLRELSAQRATVDVDTGRARAAITNLGLMIDRLRGRTPTVDVRVDAGQAEAELAAVHAMVNNLDRDDIRIVAHVNTAQAQAALFQLAIAIGGVAAIPALPVIAAGLGAVASAGVAAGAGLGAMALVAVPAIKGVTNVMQLQKQATQESARSTSNAAAEHVKGAQQALQMASAQQALTSAHRQAAQSIAQANRQVEDAERSLGQAAARTMEQRRQAAQNVERAERSLSDAKKAAKQAEDDLTQARKTAADQLRDLNDRLTEGALDQRDATLRVQEAQEELNRTMADPKATDLQRERAQLSLDQAVQSAKQQKDDYADLQKSAEAQRKAGVDGNADVQRAADQLATAQRNVGDQTDAVADAHREQARVQKESAQSVADAQRALSDAVTNASNAQVQAAESVKAAERGVESARLSTIDTTTQAVNKTDEYRKALANLTPSQRDLYDAIAGPKGLKSAFDSWQKSLQPHVLPIFTRAVEGMKKALPGLSPLVIDAADAVSDLQRRASKSLKKPFWQDFKRDIQGSAKPAITGLGVAFGNVLKGMAGVVDAFLPHMGDISKTMQRITGRFAKWGTSLKGSPEFERFLDYASTNGPKMAHALGKILDAFLEISKALSPLSGPVLDFLAGMAEGIATVAENAPWLVQMVWGIVVVTRVWTGVMWALNVAMDANPIGLVVIAIGALIAIVVIAWKKFPWFRDAVTNAWAKIQIVTSWLWENVLKPFFKWWGDNVVWLWDHVLKPYFGFMIELWKKIAEVLVWLYVNFWRPVIVELIAPVVVWLWKNIVKPYFGFIRWILEKVGNVLVWLYVNIWKPYFGFIGDIVSWLWKKIFKPVFKWIYDKLVNLGLSFGIFYANHVRPAMQKFGWIVKSIWEDKIQPTFQKLKKGLELVSAAFKSAKDATKRQWSQIANIAAKPVNFVITSVYAHGIKPMWDALAKNVGMPMLPDPPKPIKLLEAGGTVGNGWGAATPMKVNRPTAIVGEGNPRYPEYVIPTDPKYRGRAKALHAAAGTQLLESGGVLGSIWDAGKKTFSKALDWGRAGAEFLSNPGSIFDTLAKPILNSITPGVAGNGNWGKMVGKAPRKLLTAARSTLVDAAKAAVFGGDGMGGVWAKPVNVPYGTGFGVAGSMWSSGHHTGLDFPAAIGTAVRAVMDGTVTGAASGGPYGKHVTIGHPGGLSSLYAHMSSIMTQVGAHVRQGQQIGKVGATGNVTGPHLHLEARVNGRAVDPMPFLSGGGGVNVKAVGHAQQYAKSILSHYGWGQGEFGPLKALWQGESGWRWNARNPSSGAYGIPQSLPGSKMASAGSDWKTNAATQIRWGLGYIKNRPDYGSPSAAYHKWLSRSPHWYDDGGYLPTGLSLVANGTGRPEPVFTGSQWSDIRAAKGGSGTTQVHADVRVFVGDREITDIVRTEVTAREASTASAIDNGRW